MSISLLMITIVLFCICVGSVIKIYVMKKSIKEIESIYKYILNSDTNNVITITSNDKDIKKLTNSLNKEFKELRNQKLQYENGNQKLKRLMTDISHDLRTPLTAINCYVETLEEESLSEKQKECVEIIKNKAKELTSLTEQLRDLSIGIDTERKINKENCCINNILEETIASYYNSFKIKNIEVMGNSQVDKQKIIEQSGIKIGNSIFSNINIISKVRIKQNGYIEDAIVTKKMPDTIEINVKERIAEFQIITDNGYYIYIDEQGYIVDYSQESRGLVTIYGMEITEENIEKKKRLENDDLNLKLENILHIKEEMTKIGIYDQILKIQVKNEYILSLDNLNLTINLGNATNLKDKTYYIKSIMERENGKAGTINVNGNLNEGFVPYFTENQ